MESDSPGRVSSEEDIEMISLPDVVERERRQEYGHTKDAYAEEDEEPEGDERALLSGAIQTELTRETHISTGRKVWPQIKGIVVEVCIQAAKTSIWLIPRPERANPLDDSSQPPVHRKAVGHSFGQRFSLLYHRCAQSCF